MHGALPGTPLIKSPRPPAPPAGGPLSPRPRPTTPNRCVPSCPVRPKSPSQLAYIYARRILAPFQVPTTPSVPSLSMVVEPTGGRSWRSDTGPRPVIRRPPSKRPALPEQLMGRCKTNKSSQGRADAQRLVATRLLDRLHDPLGHFSRLQRIYPRASSRGFLPGSRRQPAEVHGPKAYSYPTTTCGAKSPRSGTDSDLEAFSHNPADGSVAALPGQTAAKTNYLNQRFLSY
ncbi:hypothetical protein N7491_005993 [Penicillium cf. griseofulvum]|uniref:Uncharacterized protein n=2 Tax=leotiomyceta TaxID=716546 RepID=A0A9W9J0G1_9EURO|nr:hypothetical protein N7472_010978 [Penicillium cf. griseofulvum]KAJ5186144.1 hypothetical protein N7472_010984 [Penicillium cf. griseofulvum]KAJ5186150.1 hypothetical protein N7472_010990 [Penicillium cf. griseofulvum]KAJ5186156.1 hypothetical protein N7472_010996 [Penicillium cf. griseofulvum]KAJ5186162.1 hypothetical protein N7472_011002 [Penicillium cf. griseofulvum]